MSHWDDVRRKARNQRAEVLREAGGDASAASLLAAADRLTGFQRIGLPAGDSLLDGGDAILHLQLKSILFNRDVNPRLGLFYQAHEYAHLWLHRTSVRHSKSDLNPVVAEDPLQVGMNLVDGYGPEALREREANVFAREFLLPTDELREWYEASGVRPIEMATRWGLPESMVFHQTARALLTSDLLSVSELPGNTGEPLLDPSQEEAAHVLRGPLLLEAGPGTGKTRTLVARILFLLGQNVPPSSILALTFSNRAAEEMRARIAAADPEAAPLIWIGTFHAFGLELLRRYGSQIGLPSRITVIDQFDSISLLERVLPGLGLHHYQKSHANIFHLRDFAAAISRAKDELVDPANYAVLAEAIGLEAVTRQETVRAECAIEVAGVYKAYQETLDREHLLDFGDLIFKTVSLLRANVDVRNTLRTTYRHVLVDEYQDVNRASGLLLREVSGGGAGLWVVGDTRQAIYRFRGASPENMRRFGKDFPGAKLKTLKYNYRSQPAVIDVFSGFASKMHAGEHQPEFTPWEPKRADSGGQVSLAVAGDLTAEMEELAKEIERQRVAGTPYSEQAVLCRSHRYLGMVASELERLGVPVLYLGDLFERSEVRDMLSLLSLASGRGESDLTRVAQFPEYNISQDDVRILLRLAREQGVSFPDELDLAPGADGISTPGRDGFALLGNHLEGLRQARPWVMLTQYLFERSRYLEYLLADHSVVGQQRLLALYQILQFAYDQRPRAPGETVDSKQRLLRYIRQLKGFREDRQLRQLPSWADGIEAVRLLTVHASKGLEFRSVYLPALVEGVFPAVSQSNACPPLEGMASSRHNDHDEEEECLFFVGMSRARDVLRFSRARVYVGRNRRPSSLLSAIGNMRTVH